MKVQGIIKTASLTPFIKVDFRWKKKEGFSEQEVLLHLIRNVFLGIAKSASLQQY
jgi:hypothetical protein